MTAASRQVPVVLLGPGAVGRSLLTQLLATRAFHADRLGVRFRVAVVRDATGSIVADDGDLGDAAVAALIGHKAAGRPLADLDVAGGAFVGDASWGAAAGLDHETVVVDTSAADTTRHLVKARERGWRVVTANKVPLTGSMDEFRAITRAGRGARWETTVAAALPVISSLLALVERGDHLRWVTGALSGTMGHLVQRLSQGVPLSEAVSEAEARGALEPDPRVDLSGLDVGRKALIVARTIGMALELDDVPIEGLYPPEWDALPPSAFLDRLPEADGVVAERFVRSREAGSTVRYLAYVGEGTARARLTDLSPGSRLAQAPAPDSFVLIESDHFRAHPLFISGRGGGPKLTAAGVLGDLVSLVRDVEQAPGS